MNPDKSFPISRIEIVEKLLLLVNGVFGTHVTKQTGEFLERLLFAVEHDVDGSVGLNHRPVRQCLGAVLRVLDRPAHVFRKCERVLPDHNALHSAVGRLDVDALLELVLDREADAGQLLLNSGPVHAHLRELGLVRGPDEPHEALAHGVGLFLGHRRGVPHVERSLPRIAEYVGMEDEGLFLRGQAVKARNLRSRDDFFGHMVASGAGRAGGGVGGDAWPPAQKPSGLDHTISGWEDWRETVRQFAPRYSRTIASAASNPGAISAR